MSESLQIAAADLMKRCADASTIVPIQSLEPYPLQVIRPILVVVQPDDDAFLASWFDANANGSGDTELEAIDMLKHVIARNYYLYSREEERLSDDLRRRLAVMRDFLKAV
jgi:hypothetical protein